MKKNIKIDFWFIMRVVLVFSAILASFTCARLVYKGEYGKAVLALIIWLFWYLTYKLGKVACDWMDKYKDDDD